MLDKLTDLFRQFPGVGPRQARRFAYFLLSRDSSFRETLVAEVAALKDKVKYCVRCERLFLLEPRQLTAECKICSDPSRDGRTIMVVERDVDLEAVERAGVYRGHYFVLGGTMHLGGEKNSVSERAARLVRNTSSAANRSELDEIILALSATPEGEYTTLRIIEQLRGGISYPDTFKTTKLGRGLSSGLEIEYSDSDTLKNALGGRK